VAGRPAFGRLLCGDVVVVVVVGQKRRKVWRCAMLLLKNTVVQVIVMAKVTNVMDNI
jgi:hypothetical protein